MEINKILVPELETNVKETVISGNFEELKLAIDNVAKSYEVIQYNDDPDEQIKLMKADRATLNKLKDNIDKKRKEIKNICLLPISEMESQFKELVATLDVPCSRIDNQIKEIEQEMKKKKKKEIMSYYQEVGVILEKDDANFLWKKIYRPEWENKTCSKKKYQDEIRHAIKNYQDGMTALNSLQSDFKEDGIMEFKNSLDLAQAMALINSRQVQQDAAIEREKQKLLEEENRKIREAQERAREEERMKLEEARRAEKAAQQRADEEARKAREAEEEKRKAQEAALKNKVSVCVRIQDGVLEVYADGDINLKVLDMDVAPSNEEIVAFEDAIKDMDEMF